MRCGHRSSPLAGAFTIALLASFLLVSAAVACGPGEPRGEREASAAAVPPPGAPAPLRDVVVSLSPLASRFALALGALPLLVGVDEASARIDGLADLPVVDLAGAAALAPDLVLLPVEPHPDDAIARSLREQGVTLLAFAPHDLEDALELVRSVGTRLAGSARAEAFERELSLPLAEIGGASFGRARPRVLALVGLDPLTAAGGHSFETDLIEIAGGNSVTHGGDEPRLELTPQRWSELAPDLVLVVGPDAPAAAQRRAALELIPAGPRIEFFRFDARAFWLGDGSEPARRLRALIEPISSELEARASPAS